MFSTIYKLALAATVVGTALLAAPRDADACSCLPPDLVSTYNNSSDVMVGRVLGRVAGDHTNYFVYRVRATFKGCTESGQVLLLSSPADSATCGIELRPGAYYLITAEREVSPGHYSIGLCGYNRLVRELTHEEWRYLQTRNNCCGDECACVSGEPPVSCFADPCTVDSCEEGECVANYCGGCWAEFYNDLGQAVCTACDSDDDCSWGQVCSRDRECRTECYADSDCADGQYCGADSACHDCPSRTDAVSSDVARRCGVDVDAVRERRR